MPCEATKCEKEIAPDRVGILGSFARDDTQRLGIRDEPYPTRVFLRKSAQEIEEKGVEKMADAKECVRV